MKLIWKFLLSYNIHFLWFDFFNHKFDINDRFKLTIVWKLRKRRSNIIKVWIIWKLTLIQQRGRISYQYIYKMNIGRKYKNVDKMNVLKINSAKKTFFKFPNFKENYVLFKGNNNIIIFWNWKFWSNISFIFFSKEDFLNFHQQTNFEKFKTVPWIALRERLK